MAQQYPIPLCEFSPPSVVRVQPGPVEAAVSHVALDGFEIPAADAVRVEALFRAPHGLGCGLQRCDAAMVRVATEPYRGPEWCHPVARQWVDTDQACVTWLGLSGFAEGVLGIVAYPSSLAVPLAAGGVTTLLASAIYVLTGWDTAAPLRPWRTCWHVLQAADTPDAFAWTRARRPWTRLACVNEVEQLAPSTQLLLYPLSDALLSGGAAEEARDAANAILDGLGGQPDVLANMVACGFDEAAVVGWTVRCGLAVQYAAFGPRSPEILADVLRGLSELCRAPSGHHGPLFVVLRDLINEGATDCQDRVLARFDELRLLLEANRLLQEPDIASERDALTRILPLVLRAITASKFERIAGEVWRHCTNSVHVSPRAYRALGLSGVELAERHRHTFVNGLTQETLDTAARMLADTPAEAYVSALALHPVIMAALQDGTRVLADPFGEACGVVHAGPPEASEDNGTQTAPDACDDTVIGEYQRIGEDALSFTAAQRVILSCARPLGGGPLDGVSLETRDGTGSYCPSDGLDQHGAALTEAVAALAKKQQEDTRMASLSRAFAAHTLRRGYPLEVRDAVEGERARVGVACAPRLRTNESSL